MIDDDKPDYKHDGPFYPADAARLQSSAKAEQRVAQFSAPVFISASTTRMSFDAWHMIDQRTT